MKTYIRRQQHKNFKHQDIKQKEPPQKGCYVVVGMHLNKAPSGEDWTQLDGTDGEVRLGNKGGGESSEIRYTAWYGCSRTG